MLKSFIDKNKLLQENTVYNFIKIIIYKCIIFKLINFLQNKFTILQFLLSITEISNV